MNDIFLSNLRLLLGDREKEQQNEDSRYYYISWCT